MLKINFKEIIMGRWWTVSSRRDKNKKKSFHVGQFVFLSVI